MLIEISRKRKVEYSEEDIVAPSRKMVIIEEIAPSQDISEAGPSRKSRLYSYQGECKWSQS